MVTKKTTSKKKVVDDDDDEFEDFPEDWNPVEGEEGSTLSGTITEKLSGIETQFNDNAKAVVITEEDGTERNVWMGFILLRRLWKKYDEGDEVTITFDGMKGRAKMFTVTPGLDAVEDDEEDDEEEEEDE